MSFTYVHRHTHIIHAYIYEKEKKSFWLIWGLHGQLTTVGHSQTKNVELNTIITHTRDMMMMMMITFCQNNLYYKNNSLNFTQLFQISFGGYKSRKQVSNPSIWNNKNLNTKFEIVCKPIYLKIFLFFHWAINNNPIINIVIQRETVSLNHNSSMWLDTRNTSNRNRKPPNFLVSWWYTLMPSIQINDDMWIVYIKASYSILGF